MALKDYCNEKYLLKQIPNVWSKGAMNPSPTL